MYVFFFLKAPLMNIIILMLEHMAEYNMKNVAFTDKTPD